MAPFSAAALADLVVPAIFTMEALILLPHWGLPLLALFLELFLDFVFFLPGMLLAIASSPPRLTRAMADLFRRSLDSIRFRHPDPNPFVTSNGRRDFWGRRSLTPEEYAACRKRDAARWAATLASLREKERELAAASNDSPASPRPVRRKAPEFAARPREVIPDGPRFPRPRPRHPTEEEVEEALIWAANRKSWRIAAEKAFQEECAQACLRQRRLWEEEEARKEAAALAASKTFSEEEKVAAWRRFQAVLSEPGNGSLFETILAPAPLCPPAPVFAPVPLVAAIPWQSPFGDVPAAPPPQQQQAPPPPPPAMPVAAPFFPAAPIFPGFHSRDMAQAPPQPQLQQPPPAPIASDGRPTRSPVSQFFRAGPGAMAVQAPDRPAITVQPTGGAPNPSAPSNPLAAAAPKRSADNPLLALTPLAARAEIGRWAGRIGTGLERLGRRQKVNPPKAAWNAFRRSDEGRQFLQDVTRLLTWVMEWAIDPNTLERDNERLSYNHLKMYGLMGNSYATLLEELRKARLLKKDVDDRLEEAFAAVMRVGETLH